MVNVNNVLGGVVKNADKLGALIGFLATPARNKLAVLDDVQLALGGNIHLPDLPEVLFVHKSPKRKYTFFWFQAWREFRHMRQDHPGQRIAFFDHTHYPSYFRENCIRRSPEYDRVYGVASGLHLINPGAIDETKRPYGFNKPPGYGIYDSEKQEVVFKRLKCPK